MEKYYEVIERTLELLNTLEEGFLHIQNQLSELRYEEAFTILQDVADAIASIENAIQPLGDRLTENNIDTLLVEVKNGMSNIISSYEQGKENDLENQIENEVIAAFINWKAEIEGVLRPYVLS